MGSMRTRTAGSDGRATIDPASGLLSESGFAYLTRGLVQTAQRLGQPVMAVFVAVQQPDRHPKRSRDARQSRESAAAITSAMRAGDLAMSTEGGYVVAGLGIAPAPAGLSTRLSTGLASALGRSGAWDSEPAIGVGACSAMPQSASLEDLIERARHEALLAISNARQDGHS